MIKNEIVKIIKIIAEKMRTSGVIDVAVFVLFRFGLGLTKGFVSIYVLLLLLIGVSIERVTIVYFFIALLFYCIGGWVEANFYFSYVYIGLILSVVKYFYLAVKDRKNHQ